MSTALALLADLSLILLGGSLKRRERLSARLGDVMSQLYMASAVLKYYFDQNQPEEDIDYVVWCLQYNLHKIQIACDEVTSNFPNRILGNLFRFIIFPFGRSYKNPPDHLHKKLLQNMLTPSELRDRLTKYAYLSKDSEDLSRRLETGLTKITEVDPIWKKIQKSIRTGEIPAWYNFHERIHFAKNNNLLNQNEVDTLNNFEALRQEIIRVNEFSFDLTTVIS